jgi:hypothetical protein
MCRHGQRWAAVPGHHHFHLCNFKTTIPVSDHPPIDIPEAPFVRTPCCDVVPLVDGTPRSPGEMSSARSSAGAGPQASHEATHTPPQAAGASALTSSSGKSCCPHCRFGPYYVPSIVPLPGACSPRSLPALLADWAARVGSVDTERASATSSPSTSSPPSQLQPTTHPCAAGAVVAHADSAQHSHTQVVVLERPRYTRLDSPRQPTHTYA